MLLLLSIINPVVAQLTKQPQPSTQQIEWIVIPTTQTTHPRAHTNTTDMQVMDSHEGMILVKGDESSIKSIYNMKDYKIYRNAVVKSFQSSNIIATLDDMTVAEAVAYIEANMANFTQEEVRDATAWVTQKNQEVIAQRNNPVTLTDEGTTLTEPETSTNSESTQEEDTDTIDATVPEEVSVRLSIRALVEYYQSNASTSRQRLKVTVVYPEAIQNCLSSRQSSTQSVAELNANTWTASSTKDSSSGAGSTGQITHLKWLLTTLFATMGIMYL